MAIFLPLNLKTCFYIRKQLENRVTKQKISCFNHILLKWGVWNVQNFSVNEKNENSIIPLPLLQLRDRRESSVEFPVSFYTSMSVAPYINLVIFGKLDCPCALHLLTPLYRWCYDIWWHFIEYFIHLNLNDYKSQKFNFIFYF